MGTTFDFRSSMVKYTIASFMVMSEVLISSISATFSATYWLLKE